MSYELDYGMIDGALYDRFGPETANRLPAWLTKMKAEAWEKGALWAAVECGAIRDEREFWLEPGDNPYTDDKMGA